MLLLSSFVTRPPTPPYAQRRCQRPQPRRQRQRRCIAAVIRCRRRGKTRCILAALSLATLGQPCNVLLGLPGQFQVAKQLTQIGRQIQPRRTDDFIGVKLLRDFFQPCGQRS